MKSLIEIGTYANGVVVIMCLVHLLTKSWWKHRDPMFIVWATAWGTLALAYAGTLLWMLDCLPDVAARRLQALGGWWAVLIIAVWWLVKAPPSTYERVKAARLLPACVALGTVASIAAFWSELVVALLTAVGLCLLADAYERAIKAPSSLARALLYTYATVVVFGTFLPDTQSSRIAVIWGMLPLKVLLYYVCDQLLNRDLEGRPLSIGRRRAA